MFGATPLQTLLKQAKTPQMYPFVIGFGTVFLISCKVCRVSEEQYAASPNKRFSAPFIKNKDLKEEASH